MRQPFAVMSAVANLKAMLAEVDKCVVGRKDALTAIMFAIATRNHVLMEGAPGVAKSYMTNAIFSRITDGTHFKVQCTKKMSEEYLLGPLNMRLFREEGEYEHRVEGYLPTAHFAFLDEFMDLSPGALRALLEVLNERTFSRGPQFVRCPLHTAIAATNFSGENSEELKAVIDRFLFKIKVTPLADTASRKMMLERAANPLPITKTVSLQEIRRIQAAVSRVVIPKDVIDCYLQLCSGIAGITDRTMVRAMSVIRASAVLRGFTHATIKDLPALNTCLAVTGDNASHTAFSNAFSFYKGALKTQEMKGQAVMLLSRANELLGILNSSDFTYEQAEPLGIEAREIQAAARHIRITDNGALIDRVEAVLNMLHRTIARIHAGLPATEPSSK